jgi:uncharacterized protein
MVSYHVRGILADPGQVIPVEEELTLTEVVLGGEHIPFLDSCHVQGTISNLGNEILRFDGQAVTRLEMRCARCNKPVEVPMQVEISQRFAKESAGDEDEDEDDTEPITNDHIDLENVIFHEIQLSIPMKVLCSEDCKGLCPICGQDLNEGSCHCETKETDPRWNALKDLY